MKEIPYKLPILGVVFLIAVFFAWRYFNTDPRKVFFGQINSMIEQANRGEHMALRKKLSPEAETYITDRSMPVQQALMLARRLDKEGNIRYRAGGIDVFQPRDYAEIQIERSGPNGDFSAARHFPLPFIYRKGEWLLAGGFRGDRDFTNPFE